MVVITQLIYLHPDKEAAFDEFEAHALPLVARYGGGILLRLRPTPETLVAGSIEMPHEVHVVWLPSEEALTRYMADEERQRFLHLKEESVRASLVVRGDADPATLSALLAARTAGPPRCVSS
jgi:uncharacterized protein (DUF1330 family)